MARKRQQATPPATMSVEDAAKELGISRNTAYECAKTGQLPTLRLGKRLLVPRVRLEAMLRGEGKVAGQ